MIENPQIPLSEMPLFTPRPLPEKADVDIVPLLPLDAEAGLRVMVVTYMFTFDGKLDIERLRTSLYDLIKYKWRILGARLVYNAETNALEYHVPLTFDSSNPPCSFEFKTYDSPLNEHIVQLKRLPDDISIQPNPEQNYYSFAGFDPKHTFKTYLTDPPSPVLFVYCSVFADATTIGITLPHAFSDAKGVSEIMNAWSTCLAHGIDSATIPEVPLDYNPIGGIAVTCPPVMLPGHRCFSMWENIQFAIRIVWDFVRKPKKSGRIIHFPVTVLERMKSEAHTELEESLGDSRLLLSKNDVLMAWLVKAVFHLDIYPTARDQTPAGVVIAFDSCNRLKSLFPLPYVHNTNDLMCLYPWITISEIQSLSLVRLALRIRSCTNETLTEDTLQNHIVWRMKNGQKSRMPIPYNETYFSVTSWRKLEFESVDFSAALGAGSTTSTGLEDKSEDVRAVTGTGRITLLTPITLTPYLVRQCANIPCEDGEGGIWVYLWMPDVDWAKEEFGSLKKL